MYLRLIVVLSGFAFLCFHADAQVSSNMILHANWDDNSLPSKSGGFSYNEVWGYTSNNREYAILGSLVGTIFIDVTDPSQPVEVTRINGGYPNSLWRDFKTYDTYAYGVADETSSTSRSGLQIFDLSNLPNGVSKVYDSYAFFERAHNIFIDEAAGRLYAVGVNVSNVHMVILDLSVQPDSPSLIANLRLPGGYIHDVYVQGDTAFCSHGYNGLYVYDLTDPTHPSATTPIAVFANYPNSGYNHSSWLSPDKKTLVFADETHGRHLKVLDVTDYNNLGIVSTVKSTLLAPSFTNSIAHNPFIKEDQLFISYYHEGVQVFDISDRTAPYRLAYYDTEPSNTTYSGYTGCWGVYPYLPSGIILASDVRHGLFVLELQNQVLNHDELELRAKVVPGGVALSWTSAQGSRFEVERSGREGHFTPWRTLEGQTGRHHYELTDPMPLAGRGIYRVIAWDREGKATYSNQVEVDFHPQKLPLQLFPNPAISGKPVQLRLFTGLDEPVRVVLYDLQGKPLQSWQLLPANGWLDESLHLDGTPSGVYLLQISTAIDSRSLRLLLH